MAPLEEFHFDLRCLTQVALHEHETDDEEKGQGKRSKLARAKTRYGLILAILGRSRASLFFASYLAMSC